MRNRSRRFVAATRLFATLLAIGLVVGAPATAAVAVPSSIPVNDPGAPSQWGLAAIGAFDAWRAGRGAGITVAVIDSGVDTSHEDLQGQIAGAASCIGTNGDPGLCTAGGDDDVGHGTHVAGIVAAVANNGTGVVGVAPDAKVLSIKVLHKRSGCDTCDATGDPTDVEAGIRYAVSQGAQVLNLSLGSITQSVLGPAFSAAISDAWNAGAIVVVAAGNNYILPSGFSTEPAIVVDALNRAGTKASYSSGVGAAKWALAAPGGEADDDASCMTSPNGILSTFWSSDNPTSAYACLGGTSMAAPHVAASAAILRSIGLSPQETVDRLLSTAHDLGLPGRDSTYGSGSLDIAAAVDGLSPSTSEPGSTTTSSPDTTEPQPTTSAPSVSQPSTTTPSELSTTTQAPQVTLPRAAKVTDNPDSGGPDVNAAVVAIAIALAVGIGTAVGWQLVRGAGWTRRTPR